MEGCFTLQWGWGGGCPMGGHRFRWGGAEFWKKLLDGRYSPMLLPLWETLSRQKFSFSIVAIVSISYSRYKSIVKYFLQWNQMMANFRNCSHKQWCIQWLSNPSIPVWVPKLAAQIKVELMKSNSHLTISSKQMCLHVLRHLSKTLKNVELKTLCMPGSAIQICLHVSWCIVCKNESNIPIAPVCPN